MAFDMNRILVAHINLISKEEHDRYYDLVPKNLVQMTLDKKTDLYLLISNEERQKENEQIKKDVEEFLNLQGFHYREFSIIFFGDKNKLNLNETEE